MKFLALVSGGKDSFFNIHHCLTQGHELVALGNLYPKNIEQDEIDSFMFQTVGHDIINYYAECLDVPLYRQAIEGGSKNQDLEYSKTEDDEIEDLYKLIDEILQQHPEIEAVSCGAILSHYQRTRVENICDRFGLTSLTFLWQRNQDKLMREMCDSKLDARIIKVAAIGLTAKHLNKSITELYPFLLKLNKMYDVHICGEGGEFETMVLDCSFFKYKKLEIVDSVVVDLPGDVSYLKFKVKVVEKQETVFEPVVIPNVLQDKFIGIEQDLQVNEKLIIGDDTHTVEYQVQPVVNSLGNNLYIGNLISNSTTIESQLKDIFLKLQEHLGDHDLTFNDIQHITLLVDDMNQFADINKVYQSKFENFYLPPSRVCVETKLPPGQLVQLSCKCIIKETNNKRGIHIRSRSYWAPQNIGPYSQARVEEQVSLNLATISGQIPLIPSSMELEREETKSILLTIQHFESIKTLINVKEVSLALCFITSKVDVNKFQQIWQDYCYSEGDDFSNHLIILKVSTLPKNANIELGGETYKKIESYDEEEEDEENVEHNKTIQQLKSDFPNATVINLKSLTQIIVFCNQEEVHKILSIKPGHLRVYCNATSVKKLQKYCFEFMPVEKVFDSNLKEHQYSIVATLETII